MYIEGIIERLNNPHLHNTTNPGRKVIDGTIAEYLEHLIIISWIYGYVKPPEDFLM